MRTKNRKLATRRGGGVVVIVTLSLTVLMGVCALVVDYGLLVNDKNRLQRGCDAAALAGASQLKLTGNDDFDTSRARQLATQVAAQNDVVVDSSTITFSDNNVKIRVPASSLRHHPFGAVIGFPTGRASAFALARVLPIVETRRIVPIGITQSTYDTYKNDTTPHPLILASANKETFTRDDFLVFDLNPNNSKSPAQMRAQLIGEEGQSVKVGEVETSLNAGQSAMLPKFEDALATIFQRSAAAPWHDTWSGDLQSSNGIRYSEILSGAASGDNPRVMNILVNPDSTSPSGGGTFDVPVLGFAPVYIESYSTFTDAVSGGITRTMTVRFLPPAFVSGSEVVTDDHTTPGGLRALSLVG